MRKFIRYYGLLPICETILWTRMNYCVWQFPIAKQIETTTSGVGTLIPVIFPNPLPCTGKLTRIEILEFDKWERKRSWSPAASGSREDGVLLNITGLGCYWKCRIQSLSPCQISIDYSAHSTVSSKWLVFFRRDTGQQDIIRNWLERRMSYQIHSILSWQIVELDSSPVF